MFGLGRVAAFATVILTAAILVLAIFLFFHLAPPSVITMTSGPPGSAFESNAVKYAKILQRNGVKVRILPSEGSQENLQRLNDKAVNVEVGFVQGGVSNEVNSGEVVSLGSIAYEPLLVFYR